MSSSQIKGEKKNNFIKKNEEKGDVFKCHLRKYYEIHKLKLTFSKISGNFLIYSLNGHLDIILDILYSVNPLKFSVSTPQHPFGLYFDTDLPSHQTTHLPEQKI